MNNCQQVLNYRAVVKRYLTPCVSEKWFDLRWGWRFMEEGVVNGRRLQDCGVEKLDLLTVHKSWRPRNKEGIVSFDHVLRLGRESIPSQTKCKYLTNTVGHIFLFIDASGKPLIAQNCNQKRWHRNKSCMGGCLNNLCSSRSNKKIDHLVLIFYLWHLFN